MSLHMRASFLDSRFKSLPFMTLPIRLDINREMAKLLQMKTMNEDETYTVVKQSRLSQLLITEEQVPQAQHNTDEITMYVDLQYPSIDIDLRYNIAFYLYFKLPGMVEYGG